VGSRKLKEQSYLISIKIFKDKENSGLGLTLVSEGLDRNFDQIKKVVNLD